MVERNILVAKSHAEQSNLAIDYRHTAIENLAEGSLKFDVILSNQTLYYLTDKSLNKFVIDAYDLIEDGGFLLATMMAKSHWFFSQVVSRKESLHKVDLRNTRFQRLSYINFKDNYWIF